jgi:hypothetical protein
MPQFYTLEEAARVLGSTPDELKKMAERNEVRAFRDRGTLRFRAPEIEELARLRGRGSEPDLQLGETQPAKPVSPRPGKGTTKGPVSPGPKKGGTTKAAASPGPKKGGTKPPDAPEVFDFALDSADSSDQVEIGQELVSGSSKAKGGKPPAKSPPPKPGSDSDVHLVADGSDLDFQIADSDVKMVDAPGPTATPPPAAPPVTPPKRKTGSGKSRLDSGVQMVPMESSGDSDVKMPEAGPDSGVALGKPPAKAASDSDIRLESPRPAPAADEGSDDSMLTDEIDLDAELRKAAEAEQARPKKKRTRSQPTAPPQPQLPTTSPFELSEADLDMPATPAGASGTDSSDEHAAVDESSSDFNLTPAADSSPEEPSSDEFSLKTDDEVSLGEELAGPGGKSGINLKDASDSGISLEQGGSGSDDSLEFELSMDSDTAAKPAAAPAPQAGSADSSSEFELSMEEEPQAAAGATPDSDSEFELSLDSGSDIDAASSSPTDSSSPVDSDSEFELTLDDSGSLAVDEGSGEASGEQDIFETDFDVPSLEEESGSEAVALEDSDTDLESSDFDIALGEEDAEAEDESGSQVVALEEGEGEAEAGGAVLEDSDEVEELFDVEGEEEAEEEAAGRAVAAAPAEWGVLPAAVMIPCAIVLLLVSFMSYELIRQDGLNNPNLVTKALAPLFGQDVK